MKLLFCSTGRVWRIVFPEQDTYIYNNVDGTRSVTTVLRRVQAGRRYFGIDFYYSHYYLVGRYGIPDFYKLEVRSFHFKSKNICAQFYQCSCHSLYLNIISNDNQLFLNHFMISKANTKADYN